MTYSFKYIDNRGDGMSNDEYKIPLCNCCACQDEEFDFFECAWCGEETCPECGFRDELCRRCFEWVKEGKALDITE